MMNRQSKVKPARMARIVADDHDRGNVNHVLSTETRRRDVANLDELRKQRPLKPPGKQ